MTLERQIWSCLRQLREGVPLMTEQIQNEYGQGYTRLCREAVI